MANLGGILAVLAGAGGMLISQVGGLIPSKKDFMASLKLKLEACIEDYAASHCMLVKQFISIGVENFDNVMRGDNRTSRDYFGEHSKTAVECFRRFQSLKSAAKIFRVAHYGLLISTIGLILLGVGALVLPSTNPLWRWAAAILFVIEVLAILVIYVSGDTDEV